MAGPCGCGNRRWARVSNTPTPQLCRGHRSRRGRSEVANLLSIAKDFDWFADRDSGLTLGDLQVTPTSVQTRTARMDLAISLTEHRTDDGGLAGIVGSVEFRTDPLPLSGAMKVLKKDLRAPYWEGQDRQVG